MVDSVKTQSNEQIKQLQNKLKDVYFISGLGADKRVFRRLKTEGYQPVHIDWIEPEKGESISDYAQRLATQIKSENPILVGLSFGGLIAVEMAKHLNPEKVILISSAKNHTEVPPYFKLFRWFPIHRIFPFKSLLWAVYWILFWFFSLETVDERRLLRAILKDTDANFLKWAIHQVVTWKNEIVPEHLHHIHGLNDRIFPVRFLHSQLKHCKFLTDQGGHFMVLNKAEKVSQWLDGIINLRNVRFPSY